MLQTVRQLERLLRRQIGEQRGVDVADVLRHARTARVVVHDDFQKVRVAAESRVVLLGAIERRERVVVPDVPADPPGGPNLVRLAVHVAVGVAQRFVPEPLPGEHFGILDESPPERDECAVGRPLAGAHRVHPRFERDVSLARAIRIDAGFARRVQTVRAETADRCRVRASAVVRADRVVERTLPLAAPHQAVDVVGPQIILDETEPEAARIRVAHADAGRRLAVHVDLDRFVEARHILVEDVLEPADHFHAAPMRGRQHVGDHVVAGMVRRLLGRDRRVAIELRMRRREVAAVVVVVVFLPAVIGQRVAARLTARDAASVRERREEQRVDRRHLAEAVEHFLGAFVDERHRADLDADHRGLRGGKRRPSAERGRAGRQQRALEKCAPIHRSSSDQVSAITS